MRQVIIFAHFLPVVGNIVVCITVVLIKLLYKQDCDWNYFLPVGHNQSCSGTFVVQREVTH